MHFRSSAESIVSNTTLILASKHVAFQFTSILDKNFFQRKTTIRQAPITIKILEETQPKHPIEVKYTDIGAEECRTTI